MTKKLAMLALVLTCVISAIFAVPLTEGFEGTFPPTDWTNTIVSGHAWVQDDDPYTGAYAAGYAGTGTPSEAILMTPRLDLTASTTDALSFWYKQADWAGDQNELYVELTTDGGTNWVELAHLLNAESYTQATYNLETYPQTDNAYIRFRAIDLYGYYTLIDDVTGPNTFAVDNDLQAFSITGNPAPTSGTAEVYTVSVRNPGNQTQTTYNVKLMAEDGTELASVAGTSIASGVTTPFALSWTPTTTGPMNIYGYVDFPADTAAENNSTGLFAIDVQAAGTAVVTIGTGSEVQYRAPFNFYYKSSLAQIVYPATDITVGGLLTAVSFHANIVSTDIPANLPINIWIGETQSTTLAAFIPSTQLTQVLQGTVTFTPGDNNYLFALDTPYAYGGGNLVISVERPLDTDYYLTSDVWFSTTCPSGEAIYYQSDTVAPDPANPPTATAMTLKPNVQLFFATAGMGSISGVVTDTSMNPVAGASVNIVGATSTTVTAADGTYSFPYVSAGTYSLVATMHGYSDSQVDNIVVAENMNTTADITLTMLPMVNLSGQIIASDTNAGVAGTIELTGYEDYMVDTDASGSFTVAVFAGYEYAGVASADGYAPTSFTATVGNTDLDLGTIMVTEVMIPANTVVAALNGAETEVDITWNAPGGGGTEAWLHKDDGVNNDGIGLTNGGTFKVAVKFEANEITDYNGMYLSRINYFPNAVGTYTLKVWSGVDGLNEIYSQPITNPVLEDWNEVQLTQAVTVDASVPLWIGYEVTHLAGAYVAGCDAGPHVAGGDMIMMSTDTAWGELHVLAAALDFNWNIQGFVSWSPMARSIANHSVPIATKAVKDTKETFQLARSGNNNSSINRIERPLIGYNVYRLNSGQETNPTAWTLVGASLTDLNYTDTDWTTVAPGFYRWAVRAIYTNDVEAGPAFSNELIKDMTGYIDGTVVDAATSAPIAGAVVTINDQTVQTDGTGYYMIPLLAGVYTVTCAAPGYVSQTEENVAVTGTQVTTVNFALAESAVIFEDGFEGYTDFVLAFAPWTQEDIDGLPTYGFTGTTFENSGYTGSYIIFNPSMTTPALELPTHEGDKFAACFAGIPAAPVTANNDWLISPQLHINDMGSLSFWARSYVADYGLERFKVGVSTTGTATTDFTFITGTNYLEAPVEWTEYVLDLNSYANQDIYIAFNCVSTDAFIFLLDAVAVDSPNANEDNPTVPVVTELKGNYPNPFNPVTTINYSVKNDGPVSIDIYNIRGQKVRSLVDDVQKAGNHTIVWNGSDNTGKVVSSGVYFYKMNAGNYSQTKKMMLMK